MRRKVFPTEIKASRFVLTIVIGLFSVLLLKSVVASIAFASPYKPDSEAYTPPQSLQTIAILTPTLQVGTTSPYSFSLATLGYDEITLASPSGAAQYSFRLPENWLIQTDAIFDLDLSYVYSQTNTEEYPSLFGELIIELDNQPLKTFPLDKEILDNYQLQIALPSVLLANPNRTQHTLDLILDTESLCAVSHKAQLVIHPTSSITLDYTEYPLSLDLSRYPRPFYQQAFDPDKVRFILPSQPITNDITDELAVAAKLGDLTNNRLVISATTDLDLNHLLPLTSTMLDEHLIVIGRPQNNQLLPLLNDIVNLPVSLHQQQLDLATRGPTSLMLGDTYTYLITITNTTNRAVNLKVIDSLSPYAELIDCAPDCIEDSDNNTAMWKSKSLVVNETLSLSLTLKATDIFTGVTIENTITVIDADLGPVNADTLISTVVTETNNSESQVSVAEEGGYFFVYNGQAVAKEDGIVQEILSPWRKDRAILIITGLSDGAVRKAAQAMSSETRFPGMNGAVALIRETLTPSEVKAVPAIERTFADLGYNDIVVRSGNTRQQLDYSFYVPNGWQLTKDAFIEINFSHSQLIDYKNSGLTVLLNRQPISSMAFNETTADGGQLKVSLADANIRPGEYNRLSLEVIAPMPGVCTRSDQAWVLIKRNSKIFLTHSEEALDFDLGIYPYPFHLNPTLTDLLFVLPEVPTINELENALRLAASLGNSAGGKAILPGVMMGSDLPAQDLGSYQIIALGRPSRNTLIQQVNPQLPQPFLLGTDQIDQRLDNVVFRLPPDIDLGYIQLIPSPWNKSRAFLAITGTTDRSVSWAVDVLVSRPGVAKGNLTFIKNKDEIKTIDTRELINKGVAIALATAVPITPVIESKLGESSIAETEAITTPILPSSNLTSNVSTTEQIAMGTTRPAWLIPFVGLMGLIVIAIFVFAFWQSRRRT